MHTSSTTSIIDLMAHDLRNAVNVIVQGAQLLGDGGDADTARDMEVAARSLATMVDRVIECARADLAESPPELVEVTLGDLVALAERRLARAGTTRSLGVGPGASRRVRVVPERAERLLVDTMLQAGEDGDVTLEWSASEAAVSLVVDGPGVKTDPRGRAARNLVMATLADASGAELTVLDDDGRYAARVDIPLA